MNILCDFHHSDLWWSNHLIFEKALGHTLYRPRGMEWFERGYYYQTARDTAKQFLEDSMFTLENAEKFPIRPIKRPPGNIDGLRAGMETISGCQDYPIIKTLTVAEFADTKIDVIMATLSNNQEPWFRLRNDLKPSAKLVREEGNLNGWASMHPEYRNVLTSDLPTFQRLDTPSRVLYHQRFDTDWIFTYSRPTVFNRISCFMPGFRGCDNLVIFAEAHDFGGLEFLDYGHHSKHGFLNTKEKYSKAMRETSFVWHVKPGGDGFGHVIHNSFAMGRPVITMADDYRSSIAWPLLLDGRTCILIGKDPIENSKKIRSMLEPETIMTMSRFAAERFRQIVDYDNEADQIRTFLERLL